ncbi:hypothetical protein A2V82_15650 [candidate division KSB1 bacterium RBG_16_48_16]|nr:MAG: hypothetical protein A2V82_15650 [candidate division KSB1 bacterium RBG_16_48_16]
MVRGIFLKAKLNHFKKCVAHLAIVFASSLENQVGGLDMRRNVSDAINQLLVITDIPHDRGFTEKTA